MRERFVEPDAGADPIGVLNGQPRPQILIPRFACSKHDERRVETRELVGDRRDQIEAFLIDHA